MFAAFCDNEWYGQNRGNQVLNVQLVRVIAGRVVRSKRRGKGLFYLQGLATTSWMTSGSSIGAALQRFEGACLPHQCERSGTEC